MSAFVIESSAMDRVVRTICARGRYGQILRTFAGIDTAAPDAPQQIGRRLFTLNVEAVMQRYPDTEDRPSEMPGTHDASTLPHSYVYRGSRVPPAHAELIAGVKAMKCLRYQCAEGDVPKSEQYRELDKAIGEVCEHIVSELPAYDAARWG